MVTIKKLNHLNPEDLSRLVTGYTSNSKYAVSKTETDSNYTFTLELVSLSRTYHKRYEPINEESLVSYREVVLSGYSFGAYEDEVCVGMVIAEPRQWNLSLWVWELHVAEAHRRNGIGHQLIDALTQQGHAGGLRTLVCETQNTNLPAINFYRQVGFELEAIDLSYYSNEDFPDGEIAIFMKKRLC